MDERKYIVIIRRFNDLPDFYVKSVAPLKVGYKLADARKFPLEIVQLYMADFLLLTKTVECVNIILAEDKYVQQ